MYKCCYYAKKIRQCNHKNIENKNIENKNIENKSIGELSKLFND